MATAFSLGNYDEPCSINSEELVSPMKIGSSTLVNHRSMAERKSLAQLIYA